MIAGPPVRSDEARPRSNDARRLFVGLGLALVLAAQVVAPPGAFAAESSEPPAATASPAAAAEAAEAMCKSADDLRLIVGFLRDNSIAEDGLVLELVGAIAGVHEARQLLGLVDATYRPLVEDLVASFGSLRTTIDELGAQATIGAGVATVGEAITAIGEAMDALSVALRDPCPVPAPFPEA